MGQFLSRLEWVNGDVRSRLSRSSQHNQNQLQLLGHSLLRLSENYDIDGIVLTDILANFEKVLSFSTELTPQRLYDTLAQHCPGRFDEYQTHWHEESIDRSRRESLSIRYEGWVPKSLYPDCYTITPVSTHHDGSQKKGGLCQLINVKMLLFHLQISNESSVNLLYEELCNIIDSDTHWIQSLLERDPEGSTGRIPLSVLEYLERTLSVGGIQHLVYNSREHSRDMQKRDKVDGIETTIPLQLELTSMGKEMTVTRSETVQRTLPISTASPKTVKRPSRSKKNGYGQSMEKSRSKMRKEKMNLVKQRELMSWQNSKVAASMKLMRRDRIPNTRSRSSTRQRPRRNGNDEIDVFVDKLRDEERKADKDTLVQGGILRRRHSVADLDKPHKPDPLSAYTEFEGDISSNDEEENDEQVDEQQEESDYFHQIVRMSKLLRQKKTTKIVAIAMSFFMELDLEDKQVQNAFALCHGYIPLLRLLSHSDRIVRICTASILEKLLKKNLVLQTLVGQDTGLKILISLIIKSGDDWEKGSNSDQHYKYEVMSRHEELSSPRRSKCELVADPFTTTSSVTLLPQELFQINFERDYTDIDFKCLLCNILAKCCEAMSVRRKFYVYDGVNYVLQLIYTTIQQCPLLCRLVEWKNDSGLKSSIGFASVDNAKFSDFGRMPSFLYHHKGALDQIINVIPLIGQACTIIWKACRSRRNQSQVGRSKCSMNRYSNPVTRQSLARLPLTSRDIVSENGIKVLRDLLSISQVFPVLMVPVYGAIMFCAQNPMNREEIKRLGIIETILTQFNDYDKIVSSLSLVEKAMEEQQQKHFQERMDRWNEKQAEMQKEQQTIRQNQQQRGLSMATSGDESDSEVRSPPPVNPPLVIGSLRLQLQTVLMGTLFSVSNDTSVQVKIFREHKQLLKLLAHWYQTQPNDLTLISYCTGALWKISELPENAMTIYKLDIIPNLVRKLVEYAELFAPNTIIRTSSNQIIKNDDDSEPEHDVDKEGNIPRTKTEIPRRNPARSQRKIFETILRYTTGCLSNCAKILECRKQMVSSGIVAPLCQLLKSTAIPSLLVNSLKTIGMVAPESTKTFDIVFQYGGMKQFWSLLRNDNPEVRTAAALAICNTIDTEPIARKVGSIYIGGLPVLVHILRRETDSQVIGHTCLAIARMCVCEANRAILSEEGAALEVAKVIQRDKYQPAIKASAALAISELGKYRNSRKLFFDLGAIAPLAKNLQIYSQHNHAVNSLAQNQFNETTMNEADEEQQYKDLAQNTALALSVLSQEVRVARMLRELNTVSYLIKLLSSSNHELQMAAATTIANIRKCYVSDQSQRQQLRRSAVKDSISEVFQDVGEMISSNDDLVVLNKNLPDF